MEEIATLIAADPLWTQLDREFRSIKGVATRTVAPLMAGMPEIGTLSNNPRAVRPTRAPCAASPKAWA
ncbi:MAG: hypothetical protein ABSA94_17980 [Acidobacteriaceae bacterium]